MNEQELIKAMVKNGWSEENARTEIEKLKQENAPAVAELPKREPSNRTAQDPMAAKRFPYSK